MTYKNIQDVYKKKYGKTIRTCWIADVKAALGLTSRKSANRINPNLIKYPCKDKIIRKRIEVIITGPKKTCP